MTPQVKTVFFSLRDSLYLFLFSWALLSVAQQTPNVSISAPSLDLVLRGEAHGSQNHSYIEVPFHVPAGVERVTLTFRYTEREKRTTLDLGLLDPGQLRCWSGGNKSMLTVGLSDATPSCLPGRIPAGEWNVLIGVPNIRPGVTSHYTIDVYFTRSGLVAAEPSVLRQPLRTGPAWYRGDLHMHTAHSDGQCPSQTGRKVPCPVFFTVDAAAKRGLDFIAITDHNATSQYDAMRELQPYFDRVLLIPGREITTFYGHMNFLGTTDFIDFRVGSKSVPEINTLLRRADNLGALVSINHPDAPTGERCMGCGWTPATPVDMHLLAAVEAINGGSEMYGNSSVPFWNKQLDEGYRLSGIGGSDNHNAFTPASRPSSVGSPTTVVFASELSTPAILTGIRDGHVFIDLTTSNDRLLEVTAKAGGEVANMGDLLKVKKGVAVSFDIHVVGASDGKVALLEDGQAMQDGQAIRSTAPSAAVNTGQEFHYAWTGDGHRHWFRAQVTGPDGKLWLLGNPVYVDWGEAQPSGGARK